MTDEKSDREKVRKIVNLLPKENCGKCGFENCGKFAMAVVGGEASPFGCRNNPAAGYEISKVLGIEVPEGVPAAYPGSSQIGISTGIGAGWGRGQGYGRGRGHSGGYGLGRHNRGYGHSKGRGGHRNLGRHHAKWHSHLLRGIIGRIV